MPKTDTSSLGKLVFKLLLFLYSILIVGSFSQALAQQDNSYGIKTGEALTQPKERVVKVTASVNDKTPPSIPILIAPPNGSLLSNNLPTFVWKESTDAFGIQQYALTLDGTSLFSTIPTTPTDSTNFTLTYDSLTGYYSLTPKAAITDGTHTWKVTAIDSYDNTADSVTWSFTIDSQSPVFVITKVDGQVQSISAQDTSTIPTVPLELSQNEPILAGTGEAKSSVKLTVSTKSGELSTYTFTIADNGIWEIQLGVLPRDEVVYLSFRITDLVDHVSLLENLPLILKTPKIIIPPVPFLPTPEKPIAVPIPPAKEVIQEIITTITPPTVAVKLLSVFPVLAVTPRPVGQFSIWSILVIVLISILPILKTIILSGNFGSDFTLKSLVEIWKVIGLLPVSKPQGVVVFQSTQEPVPFAKVIITGKLDSYRHTTTTRLTTSEGIYFPSNLPNGLYQVAVIHPAALFPTLTHKPGHLTEINYYQGQEFKVSETSTEPNLIIPVDKVTQKETGYFKVTQWLLHQKIRSIPLFIVSVFISILASSYINIAGTLFYGICLILAHRSILRKSQKGQVITNTKEPLQNAVLLTYSAPGNLAAITQSSDTGVYRFYKYGQNTQQLLVDFSYKVSSSSEDNRLIIVEPTR